MNKGVELLLERMETHPEEFMEAYDGYGSAMGKWDRVLNELHRRVGLMDRDAGLPDDGDKVYAARLSKPFAYLTDEEVRALYSKLMEAQAKTFNQVVMGILLGDSHDPREKGVVLAANTTGNWTIAKGGV